MDPAADTLPNAVSFQINATGKVPSVRQHNKDNFRFYRPKRSKKAWRGI